MRILQAFIFAAWGHRKQRDKAGARYIWHLVRVAWIAYGLTGQLEAVVVGLLHDYMEDVEVAPKSDARLSKRFGVETAGRIGLLTRDQAYPPYIDRLVMCGDLVTISVKIADLLDNTRPDRLKPPLGTHPAEWRRDRTHKYRTVLEKLIYVRATMVG